MTKPNKDFPAEPFYINTVYTTLGGDRVLVYETGRESVRVGPLDGPTDPNVGWRYNRPGAGDHGRCTGTEFDFTDQRNLIPEDANGRQHPHALIYGVPGIHSLLTPIPDVLVVQPEGTLIIASDIARWDIYTLVQHYDGAAHYERATTAYVERKGKVRP